MRDDFRKQLYRNLNQKSTEELTAIWQTNNRAEWSELTFDVIQEILQVRLNELPPQNEPITELTNDDDEKIKKKNVEMKFNWMLPILGAIGFGVGFALVGGIMLTIYHNVTNSWARVFSEDLKKDAIILGALRGVLAGGIGGAGLGWALKNKKRAQDLSLAGAIGFGISFALVIFVDSGFLSDIGWALMRLMGAPAGYSEVEASLARGLGMGTIIGALGGLALGLTFPRHRAISSLLLCVAGIFSFGNVFAVGSHSFDGRFFSSWNALGGAIGGAFLGIAFALYFIISDRLDEGIIEKYLNIS